MVGFGGPDKAISPTIEEQEGVVGSKNCVMTEKVTLVSTRKEMNCPDNVITT